MNLIGTHLPTAETSRKAGSSTAGYYYAYAYMHQASAQVLVSVFPLKTYHDKKLEADSAHPVTFTGCSSSDENDLIHEGLSLDPSMSSCTKKTTSSTPGRGDRRFVWVALMARRVSPVDYVDDNFQTQWHFDRAA